MLKSLASLSSFSQLSEWFYDWIFSYFQELSSILRGIARKIESMTLYPQTGILPFNYEIYFCWIPNYKLSIWDFISALKCNTCLCLELFLMKNIILSFLFLLYKIIFFPQNAFAILSLLMISNNLIIMFLNIVLYIFLAFRFFFKLFKSVVIHFKSIWKFSSHNFFK